MDEATALKTAIEAGGLVLLAVIVWKFIDILRLAMTSQANAYDSLRQWFASELGQRDADMRIEKAERMKLEARFDDQCQETERLKARIAELEEQLADKVAEIERLKISNKQLKENDVKKDERIRDLEIEIKRVKEQRDELVKRLDDILAADDKGNGKDHKEKRIADHIDERQSVRAEEKK